ncbi:hypothetical protein [Novosphingobium sp.]|jgi:hypothetical protein|uniref:hypothetical protein n=1 Tax=Novosphingobium sp. TaxID=1874826 RepID=UPI002FDF42B1
MTDLLGRTGDCIELIQLPLMTGGNDSVFIMDDPFAVCKICWDDSEPSACERPDSGEADVGPDILDHVGAVELSLPSAARLEAKKRYMLRMRRV